MVEVFRTDPVADGRYLAFAPVEGAKEWCLPIVLLWADGKWCYEYSKIKFPRKVWARTDLLPVGKLIDLFPEAPLEFDL